MKKVLSIILSLTIVLSLAVSICVSANDNAPIASNEKIVIDHVVYAKEVLDDDEFSNYYIVDKFFDSVDYAKTAKEINVLAVVNDLPVKKINVYASQIDNRNIKNNVTKVSLPNSIIEIGAYAFTGFKKLETIELPKELKTIDERAFNLTTSLKKIIIPAGVKEIEEGAFYGCKALSKVVFNGKVKEIEDNAFSKCKNLKNIVLPNSVREIGEAAFYSTGLTTITMPSKIRLTSFVFSNCKNLSKVILKGNKNPSIISSNFDGAKKGIKFYVDNKKIAKNLKKQLKNNGAKNPKIYYATYKLYK